VQCYRVTYLLRLGYAKDVLVDKIPKRSEYTGVEVTFSFSRFGRETLRGTVNELRERRNWC